MILKIYELRKLNNITQLELANYLGVSYQAVSKWENGASYPDIVLLPKIADFFKVSTDQLLGLMPLDDKYILRLTDKGEYWSERVDYLLESRKDFWNIDYLKHLVNTVWEINEPVNILDCGCGYGYLGSILLPLLPDGSTYTGIDLSKDLIEKGKELFPELRMNLINVNILDYNKGQYDIVISQAVLRHSSNPEQLLSKMYKLLKENGLLISIEVNRKLETSGIYIDGLIHRPNYDTIKEKLWEKEFANGERDYRIGVKIASLMSDLGLSKIDARVNDRVTILNPKDEDYSDKKKRFMFLNKPFEDENHVKELLINRGLTMQESIQYIEEKKEMYNFLDTNNPFIFWSYFMIITFGYKEV